MKRIVIVLLTLLALTGCAKEYDPETAEEMYASKIAEKCGVDEDRVEFQYKSEDYRPVWVYHVFDGDGGYRVAEGQDGIVMTCG